MIGAERAPCGCVFGTTQEKAFVFTPCSQSCELYAYAKQRARETKLPVEIIDMTASAALPFAAHCPFCGHGADGYTGHRDQPKDGDRAVCYYCARVAIYTAHGLRKPTPEEAAEHFGDPTVSLMVQQVKDRLQRRARESN